jgi:ABC-type glycerol-3-phosphate transport system permease component
MLVVMAIPIVGSSPAMVSLLRDLGIHDTIFAMVALNFNFTGIYFFVFHAYLTGISDTYVEAAEIDGASQLGVFIKIIFPLCLKTFFTVFLLQFIQTWNDYQTPLLYYPNHPTLAYAVFRMTNNTGGADKGMEYQGVPQRVAGCMVLAIPIFAIFVAFNKLLMGNLTMGGLKE